MIRQSTAAWTGPGAPSRRARRVMEVIPTALVWVAITAPIWAPVVAPQPLGLLLVLFSAYWLWKSIGFAIGAAVGFWRMERARRRDWAAAASALPDYAWTRHVVIVPTYGEPEETVADTLYHLASQDVPLDRVVVVLAFEERDQHAPARAQRLAARFRPLFGDLLVTFHPDRPGEVRGKSSNLAWAARRVEEELIASGRLDALHTLATVCDADSRLHPRYLAAVSHAALTHPDGRYQLYQPAILFYANHWRLPAGLRALNSVLSLYELARMVKRHRLVVQSTYTLNWATARAVGFWDVDVIPEDSHMFFKVFFHFGRRVRAWPIFLPVYADAAEGPTLWRTLVNQYHQLRRWAWGVSDIPYVVQRGLRASSIPWHLRLARVGWYIEEHLVWPAHWFLLMLGGLLPSLINPGWAKSELGAWQTGLSSTLLGFAAPCLAIVAFVDWRLRPHHPDGEQLLDLLLGWAGFLALPIVGLALVTIPALDAHTRLLLGRHLEYRVTEKVPVRARFRGESWAGPPRGGSGADGADRRALLRAARDPLPRPYPDVP